MLFRTHINKCSNKISVLCVNRSIDGDESALAYKQEARVIQRVQILAHNEPIVCTVVPSFPASPSLVCCIQGRNDVTTTNDTSAATSLIHPLAKCRLVRSGFHTNETSGTLFKRCISCFRYWVSFFLVPMLRQPLSLKLIIINFKLCSEPRPTPTGYLIDNHRRKDRFV